MNERIYEMLFIVPADLEEQEQQEVLETVEKTLTENGTIYEMKEWKKRRLAYPIKRCTEGIYHLAYFNSSPEAMKIIDMRLNQMEKLLRHTTLRIDESYRRAKLPLPFQMKKEADAEETEETENG